jgi:hypothetical protein
LSDVNDRIGEEKTNNFGSTMIIKEYRGCMDIDVYFPKYNYTTEHVQYDNFKKGNIKCVYEPRTFEVGYLGEGEYNTSINGKSTKYHEIWIEMLRRCYSPKYIEKYPTYKGSEVCSQWHNFQNFARWVEENYYNIGEEQICLDKDILIKGNKIYSPQTCVFVPQTINKLFTKSNKCRGNLPIGVSRMDKKYRACCSVNKKNISLGCYDTPEEAFQAYKNFKEKYIKEIAEKYKDKIPSKLYDAMIMYQVEIDD